MNQYEAFKFLQIEITSDKRVIRQAYSKLVKRYHPEEDPEGWAMLRSAFETALTYADRGHSGIVREAEREDARIIPTVMRTGERENEDSKAQGKNEKHKEHKAEEEYEYREIADFFENRTIGQEKTYDDAENLVLTKLRSMHDTQSVPSNDWYRVFAMPEMYLVRTSYNVLTTIRNRLRVQLPPDEVCRFLKDEMRKTADQVQRMPDTKSRKVLMELIGEIESCLKVSDNEEKLTEVINQSPKKEIGWFDRIGYLVVSFLLFLVPVGLSEVLGWVESRKESFPKTVATQEQVHVYEHYVPEAEEALAGARIGDPQAEEENIMRLYNKIYYDDSFELRESSDEHHWLRDRSSHIPEEFTIPDNWEWIGALYASSKDEKAEDVIICMALKEYGLEKYGFDVYEYDEDQGAYLAEKITYLGNSSDLNGDFDEKIDFPYVYHDVLYMHVNEYEIGYEGQKYLTILVQTK